MIDMVFGVNILKGNPNMPYVRFVGKLVFLHI